MQAQIGSGGYDWVIIEGFRCFFDPRLVELMDLMIWLEIDKQTCFERRQRTKSVPTSVFEADLWPCHIEYREQVRDPGERSL